MSRGIFQDGTWQQLTDEQKKETSPADYEAEQELSPREQKIALKYFLLGAIGKEDVEGIALLELPEELVEECCRQRAAETFKDL